MKNRIKYLALNLVLLPLVILFFFAARVSENIEENSNQSPKDVDTSINEEIKEMKLVWSDEFNYEGKPDPNKWGYEYGFVRNRELQWYQPQNASCKNGRLIIEGREERIINPNYNPQSGDWRSNNQFAFYSSSCLLTKGLHEWPSYGYFEIKSRFDPSIGSWPAIWLLGTENPWPHCGEIDIMEFYRINNTPTLLTNVAWGAENNYYGNWNSTKVPLKEFLDKDPEWSQKFHIYSMKWDKDSIRIYIDGKLISETFLDKTINPDGTNPFSDNKKHYLLLNLAIGSNGGVPDNNNFPLKFEIDYVRVYKNKK